MKHPIRLFTSGLLILLAGCTSLPDRVCDVDVPTLSPRPPSLEMDYLSIPRRNAEREQAAWQMLETAGCHDLRRIPVKGSARSTLVCTLPGRLPEALLIGAHHDRTGAGQGAADNWTGVSILAGLAAYFTAHPPIHTIHLVAFAEEEDDLRGSAAYVRSMKQGDEARPRAMINIDTIGVSSLAVDARSDSALRCLAGSLAVDEGTALRQTRIRDMTGDWEPFHLAGVPVLSFHSLKRSNMTLLHTYRDRQSLVDDEKLETAWQVIAATVSAVDYAVDLTVSR